jgi:hypothetical protein
LVQGAQEALRDGDAHALEGIAGGIDIGLGHLYYKYLNS